MTSKSARAFDTIVIGGLAAGVIDISDAFIVAMINGRSPVRVLYAIASGLLSAGAAQGGAAAAALGLALHFFIATTAAAVYFLATRRMPILVRRPLIAGPLFGLAVWAVMYHVVLPLTFGRPYAMPAWSQFANQLGIHAFGVGLPIALIATASSRKRARS